MGTAGVNFCQAQYAYDADGRRNQARTGNGTIYRTVYDSLGRPVSDWVGTNDTPTSGGKSVSVEWHLIRP